MSSDSDPQTHKLVCAAIVQNVLTLQSVTSSTLHRVITELAANTHLPKSSEKLIPSLSLPPTTHSISAPVNPSLTPAPLPATTPIEPALAVLN